MHGYKKLVNALEQRFDFMSARVMARQAIRSAGLNDHSDWNDEELRMAVANLPGGGSDLAWVFDKLGISPVVSTAEKSR